MDINVHRYTQYFEKGWFDLQRLKIPSIKTKIKTVLKFNFLDVKANIIVIINVHRCQNGRTLLLTATDPPPRRHEPLHPGRRAGPRQLGARAAGPGGEVQAGQGRAAGDTQTGGLLALPSNIS